MSYSRIKEVLDLPDLIEVQKTSYNWFLEEGMKEVFDDISPIQDYTGNIILEFVNYHIGDNLKYDEDEARERDANYSAPLKVKVRLINKETGEVKEQEVFMGDLPLMTEKGTFIINGAERVVVSQLVRSPGVYYVEDRDKTGKRLYSSTVIPNRGAWLEYETDSNDIVYVRIDRTRKIPITVLLRALNIVSNTEIIEVLGETEQVLKTLENKWENLLSRIQLSKDTSDEYRKMFYTGLYHTMIMPVDRTGENPLWTNDEPYYDDFYTIWDTFRTSSPLITLIDIKRKVEIINAMLNIYKREGYMPEGRSGNDNGRTQGGSNAEVVIADAFVKNLKGIDYELALQAMLKDATVPPGGNEEKEGRGGLLDYLKLGYVPYGTDRAGNRTIDYSYNDYNIATVAKGLGKTDLYNQYIKQAENWQNLWRADYENNGAKGFIMPKDKDGNWLDDVVFGESKIQKPTFKYTPVIIESPWYVCHWCVFFYEGTSWEYSFSLPHDIPELVKKSGGEKAFENRLDIFFDNNLFNVANEPSFLTPCLYHWIGKPYLSSNRIRTIIKDNFNTSREGLPGNDDSGAMSSWLAFHMMGLYPNAGQPYYLINTPLIKETVVKLENGKSFKIITKKMNDKNKYIKTALLNGKPYNKAWIMHDDIMNGGELILEMDSKPSAWGTTILPPAK